jgi:hypothetical protein
MRRKLGLTAVADPGDDALAQDLLDAMAATGSDFTNTFRQLASFPMPPPPGAAGGAGEEGAVDLTGVPKAAAAAAHPAGAADSTAAAAGERPAGSGGDGGASASTSGSSGGLGWPDGGLLEWLVGEAAGVEEMARAAGSRMPWANLQVRAGGGGCQGNAEEGGWERKADEEGDGGRWGEGGMG